MSLEWTHSGLDNRQPLTEQTAFNRADSLLQSSRPGAGCDGTGYTHRSLLKLQIVGSKVSPKGTGRARKSFCYISVCVCVSVRACVRFCVCVCVFLCVSLYTFLCVCLQEQTCRLFTDRIVNYKHQSCYRVEHVKLYNLEALSFAKAETDTLPGVFRPTGEGAVPGSDGETELTPPTLARTGEGSGGLREAQEGGGERGWTPAV